MGERKVFLDELPKKEGVGINKGKQVIDWASSVGYKIKFKYNDVNGVIKILNRYKDKKNIWKLVVEYNENKFSISQSNFASNYIGTLIGKRTQYHKYSIGDIIKCKKGEIKILNSIGLGISKKYKYICLTCGNVDEVRETNLNKKNGCNVCAGKKILIGINDIKTINPVIAKMMNNQEDAKKYTLKSNRRIDWKCNNCGNIIKNKCINDVVVYGLSCSKCGDGVSYPEKIMYNVLHQLEIHFKKEYSPNWAYKKRYDFYISSKSMIIEMQGMQHYEQGFNKSIKGSKSLQEIQKLDKYKKEIALENSIKNYVIIDSRYSNINYIRKMIYNSELNKIFDLSKIDWDECEKFALNSLVKETCNLWNGGIKSIKEISKIMNLSQQTVRKYLKKGTKIKLCNFIPSEPKRKIININYQYVFNSLTEACKNFKIKNTGNVSNCCQGKSKSAGKHPITGEPLKWMYYDDFIDKYGDEGLQWLESKGTTEELEEISKRKELELQEGDNEVHNKNQELLELSKVV